MQGGVCWTIAVMEKKPCPASHTVGDAPVPSREPRVLYGTKTAVPTLGVPPRGAVSEAD